MVIDTAQPYPDLTSLYRWPFGIDDNPNVVIEPVAYCNLSCPGCYRDASDLTREQAVMTLEEVKAYIDTAMEQRRVDTLSFLGGEPLLYDRLEEAILYGVERGLNVGLYTNGELLTRYRLRELKGLGLSYLYVHVDRHQGRGDTEEETNRLRERFCEMFRRVGGLNFGFGVILHESDVEQLATLAGFLQRNADVIRFVNLSILGAHLRPEMTYDAVLEECERVDARQRRICAGILDTFGVELCSFLASKFRTQIPGKLLAVTAYRDGVALGSLRPQDFADAIERYRREKGRYPYLLSRAANDTIDDCTRFGANVDWQYVAVSLSPLFLPERVVNACDSCTDCVLYQGHFVPMCLLDPFRHGNEIVKDSVRYW